LLAELGERERVDGELVLAAGPRREAYWVRDIWTEPRLIRFSTPDEGAEALASIAPRWTSVPGKRPDIESRIASLLPAPDAGPRRFPLEAPIEPHGSWTSWDDETLLASPSCEAFFPGGDPGFPEIRKGPPSRAYRKLWEALSILGDRPRPGDRCLDAGAAPGGWTWVIAKLGASVIALDRAPLDPSIQAMKGVEYRRGSAFSLSSRDTGKLDWLFSDVICYPEKLYAWISRWLEEDGARRYVCTIKMQGPDWDQATTRKLARIPGARVLHLFNNKHELTWLFTKD
jgi:23S rRNA (cytidine2498-2'-O)-methyltransferase